MKKYLDALRHIYENGHDHPDRTGTGRRSVFGLQLRFNLQDGFPMVTSRQTFYRKAFEEMIWFISGDNNIKALQDKKNNIWDSWAVSDQSIDKYLNEIEKNLPEGNTFMEQRTALRQALIEKHSGSIGPMYGYIWRNAPVSTLDQDGLLGKLVVPFDEIASDKLEAFREIYEREKPKGSDDQPIPFEHLAIGLNSLAEDQLQQLIVNLKKDPYSARHVMSAWIPEFIPRPGHSPQDNVMSGRGALAPCHVLVQCFVSPGDTPESKKKLSLQLFQRSVDFPVGAVFNITQYALLLSLLAHVTDMEPYEFIYTTGDTHIYANQLELVEEQLTRATWPLPKLVIDTQEKDLFKIRIEDISIEGYIHQPPIKYPVSV